MSILGRLNAFQPDSETAKDYLNKFDLYCMANRIDEEPQRKAVFLTSVGHKGYQLLSSLAPEPMHRTFEDLRELFLGYFPVRTHRVADVHHAHRRRTQEVAPLKAELEYADYVEKKKGFLSKLRIRNHNIRCLLAEFLGTMVLVAVGDGIVAQLVLTAHADKPVALKGNINSIHVGWGIAVTMGVLVAGGVSGGHINPAFSLVTAILGHIKPVQLIFYWIGQYLGAFAGAVCVYVIYLDRLNQFDVTIALNETKVTSYRAFQTAGIFATYPSGEAVSTLQGFADQVFGTFLLVLLALAIIDPKNFGIPKWFIPFIIGIVVSGIVASYEYNCGAALNPARDFGPRLFTLMGGWGPKVFTFRSGTWFLIPIFGPHIGGLLAAAFYTFFISAHWPDPEEERLREQRDRLEKQREVDAL